MQSREQPSRKVAKGQRIFTLNFASLRLCVMNLCVKNIVYTFGLLLESIKNAKPINKTQAIEA